MPVRVAVALGEKESLDLSDSVDMRHVSARLSQVQDVHTQLDNSLLKLA
jgi:hypothetical protein